MEHTERAWHEERGFAACRRSYHKYDCQHGQGKEYQMETLVRICEALNCGIMNVIKLEQDNI